MNFGTSPKFSPKSKRELRAIAAGLPPLDLRGWRGDQLTEHQLRWALSEYEEAHEYEQPPAILVKGRFVSSIMDSDLGIEEVLRGVEAGWGIVEGDYRGIPVRFYMATEWTPDGPVSTGLDE